MAFPFADGYYLEGKFLNGAQRTIADIAFAVALKYADLSYLHDWYVAHLRLAKEVVGWCESAALYC